MTDARRRLAELLADPDVQKELDDWATSQAIQEQDQAVGELMKREPSVETAIQHAASSKVYERLVSELVEAFKQV